MRATVYEAIEQMRVLSNDNIPFSFSFVTCNLSKGSSKGVKHVKRAKLRKGLKVSQGIKSRSLVGYIDLDSNENRSFYIPLLLTFNQIEIK